MLALSEETYFLGFFLLAQGSTTYLGCVHFCPISSLSYSSNCYPPSPSRLMKVSKHTFQLFIYLTTPIHQDCLESMSELQTRFGHSLLKNLSTASHCK